jgi:hypothetical protein
VKVTLESVDGEGIGQFQVEDTGDGGFGWNVFLSSEPLGPVNLQTGTHEVHISVIGGDAYWVEPDKVTLERAE